MAEISSMELTAAVAVVSTALTAFSTACPPMTKLMSGSTTPEHRKMLDFGQNAGALATVSVGLVLAVLAKSPMPLVIAVGISFLISFVYEFAFRREF